jgi:hypothetical protein
MVHDGHLAEMQAVVDKRKNNTTFQKQGFEVDWVLHSITIKFKTHILRLNLKALKTS